ncbi:MAG TPA: septation protein SepH [Streptosporangiaceae bacterium]|nr:septation protein SepH [Streptosporangiaceae bacterium]
MQELRLVAVSEDGSYAVLVVPGRGGRYALPIDERLRTVARGQFSRLAQYEIEVESPLRPKEIQDRIRAGETAEEIADAAGLPVDRIRRFEGPVLAEREFRAGEAQRATVRGGGEAGIGPRLGDVVAERLAELGASTEDQDWDSRKRQDGNWQVQLAYTIAGRMHVAEWVYDPRSKHVTPDDDEAIRLSLDESHWPGPRQAPPPPMTATVTPIGSRAAAFHPSRQAPAAPPPLPQVAQASQAAHVEPAALGPYGGHQVSAETGVVAAAAGDDYAALLAAGRHSQQARPEPTAKPGKEVKQDRDQAGPSHDAPSPVMSDGTAHTSTAQASTAQASTAQASTAQASTAQASGAQASGAQASTAQSAPENPAQSPPEGEGAEQPERPARPGRRASGSRSRRSSVPSWDEIMFGNSRQPD